MGAVGAVVRQRLRRRWPSLVVAGLLLGLGFGTCFASLAAARRTDSAYERILTWATAPDAAVAVNVPAHEARAELGGIEGITGQRVYGGFIGSAEGVDPVHTAGLLAPAQERFPLERPSMEAGRLPNPDALDEAFITSPGAREAGLEVGERLRFHLVDPSSDATVVRDVTIVGIGTLPIQAVADETAVLGTVVFTRAFYDAHRALSVYAVSNVDLAPGFDARRDLAPAVAELGHPLQAARSQEQQAVDRALQPLIIVLVALGLLAFVVTALVGGQLLVRQRARWRADDLRLRTLGMTRGEVFSVEAATSMVVATIAIAGAALTMLVASPVAPIGPLHDLDPAQGRGLDGLVLAVGAAIVVVTTVLVTLGSSSLRRREGRTAYQRPSRLLGAIGTASALAGLTLALRPAEGRGRVWRGIGAVVAATAVVALGLSFVGSAIGLTDTPSRYGFDAQLLALNSYGDQSSKALEEAFGPTDDVVAATAFTAGSFLVDGRAVPGVAATPVKGELTPTLLRGRSGLTAEEIVLGEDTLDAVGAELGDLVEVQVLFAGGDRAPTGATVDLRVVGVATFPAVSQMGTDLPRLGVGALVSHDAYLRMGGNPSNGPEFTLVRLAEGTDPATLVADLGGFEDSVQSTTTWFTDAKPAELVQLDSAMPYLNAARIAGVGILLLVVVHASWTRARAEQRDLAVLSAVGFTRGQLDAAVAWLGAPLALGAVALGIPLGLLLGRRVYVLFAQSLAVVDDASVAALTVGVLVIATSVAAGVGALVALTVARRGRTASVLRAG